MQSVSTNKVSVEEYKSILADKKVNFVFSFRRPPIFSHQITEIVNSQNKLELQTWLVNEPIELLEPRLIEELNKYGFTEKIASWITADIVEFAKKFIELTGDEKPFISLRSIDERYFKTQKKSVSKDWHVDTAVLTFTCTYSGRGTEWIVNDDEVREYFAQEKMPDPSLVDRSKVEVEEMTPFQVGVLKGEIRENEDSHAKEFLNNFSEDAEIEPFNFNGGLLHRGPDYASRDDRRLLLTISTMKLPEWLK